MGLHSGIRAQNGSLLSHLVFLALGFVCLKVRFGNSQLGHINKIRHVGKDRSMVALRLKS